VLAQRAVAGVARPKALSQPEACIPKGIKKKRLHQSVQLHAHSRLGIEHFTGGAHVLIQRLARDEQMLNLVCALDDAVDAGVNASCVRPVALFRRAYEAKVRFRNLCRRDNCMRSSTIFQEGHRAEQLAIAALTNVQPPLSTRAEV